ncbi:AMP-binding protein [Streptomyces sp. NPDC054842]
MSGYVWHPTPEFTEHGNIAVFCRAHGIEDGYRALHARSVADPGWFWERAAEDIGIVWHTPPSRVYDDTGGIAATRWFPDGRTNLVDSCLDRQVRQGRGRATVLRWEQEDGTTGGLSYEDAAGRSARVAGGLRALGVGEGDRVAGYLPSGPEAFLLLFACARVGAVLVPLFSGFGAEALAVRLADAGARVLVTAGATVRHGRRHDMEAVARAALLKTPCVTHLVVVQRESEAAGDDGAVPETGRSCGAPVRASVSATPGSEPRARPDAAGPVTTSWRQLADGPPAETVSLPADAPFLLLHTSGTTGRPKGAIHTHGGFPVQVGSETRYNLDLRPDDVMFWVTDPGWIMFPLVAVGATLAGAGILAYEGAIDQPGVTRLWRLLDDHQVTVFGSSPSLSRTLMSRERTQPAAPTRLRLLASTGEPWTEQAWRWYFAELGGKRCPVINICGGTEVGGSLLASAPTLPQSPCGFTGPCLGVDAAIEDDHGRQPPEGQAGELVVRQPWPGMTRGLWQAEARFARTYFTRRPGRWSHGDLVSRSGEEWFVHGRLDDVVKVAGKRLGPAEVEDAAAGDPAVAEVAAVGIPHPVKGETVWCFTVPVAGRPFGAPEAERIRARVADALGGAFRPGRVVAVPALPRTRNGKVMRRLLRGLVTGEAPGDVTALADPAGLDAIRTALQDQ